MRCHKQGMGQGLFEAARLHAEEVPLGETSKLLILFTKPDVHNMPIVLCINQTL